MDKDTQANLILGRIRDLVQSYRGHLLLIFKESGYSGTGYIGLLNLAEFIFDFSFIDTGFSIEIRETGQAVSRLNAFIDYSNEGEMESVIKLIETRIKILDAD